MMLNVLSICQSCVWVINLDNVKHSINLIYQSSWCWIFYQYDNLIVTEDTVHTWTSASWGSEAKSWRQFYSWGCVAEEGLILWCWNMINSSAVEDVWLKKVYLANICIVKYVVYGIWHIMFFSWWCVAEIGLQPIHDIEAFIHASWHTCNWSQRFISFSVESRTLRM